MDCRELVVHVRVHDATVALMVEKYPGTNLKQGFLGFCCQISPSRRFGA